MKQMPASPLESNPLFGPLPLELAENLHSQNPWWRGEPGVPLPPFRRRPFTFILRRLIGGMTPATVLRGPRQVGKTVLMRQIIQALLADGVAPYRILYVSFDELPTLRKIMEPVLAISRWFERSVAKITFNAMAHAGKPVFIFLDGVQNLDAWAEQLKSLVDNSAVRAMVTGSSSLRIEAGRDSLAGRITTVEMGPLLLREIAELRFHSAPAPLWSDTGLNLLLSRDFWQSAVRNGNTDLELKELAFAAFSQLGGYPDAQEKHDLPWHEVADHLNETVIVRAIQHDLRVGTRGVKRDEKLLEEVFRLSCRYAGQAAGQSVFVPEIQQALAGNIGWNRILAYLRFLDRSLLIRLVPPLELRLKRAKAPAKICLCDHALRAGWLQEVIPLDPAGLAADPHLSDIAGHLAESVLGYFLASIPHLDVAHFPERGAEPEVDFVLTIGTRRIPIEVKYRRRIDPLDDTRGLRAFVEKAVYNAPFGILVTLDENVAIPDPRIIPISLSSFLWTR